MPQTGKPNSKTRRELAQLAAKIVAVDGVTDYLAAKRKAAMRLGISPEQGLPTNLEVEQALKEYQALFQNQNQTAHLQTMRGQALNAMRLLSRYQPRLVGPVLSGTATCNSEITLHLVCDEPEQIGFLLSEHAIPFIDTAKTIKTGKSEKKDYPAYEFFADRTRISLVIFPERQQHSVPLSTITGKPMRRAAIGEVEKLIRPYD
jgi:hypothetical protein